MVGRQQSGRDRSPDSGPDGSGGGGGGRGGGGDEAPERPDWMFAVRRDRSPGFSVAADVEVGALLGRDGGDGVQPHLVVHHHHLLRPGYLETLGLCNIFHDNREREGRKGDLPRLRKMVLVTLSSWQLLMLMLARVVLTNVLSVIPTYFTSRALICTGKCSHVK